ncbi:MAG: hypothetical protein IPI60_20295 [Saprospiraceae bacterium]|nr:hypothetical protein [Saprospiraceae bacterium]
MKFLKVPLRERIIKKAVQKRQKSSLSKRVDIANINELIIVVDYNSTDEKMLDSCSKKLKEKFAATVNFILYAEHPADILHGYHLMNRQDLKSSLEIKNEEILQLLSRKYSLALFFNPEHKQEIQYLATQVQSDLIIGSEKYRIDLYDIIMYDGDAMNLRSFVDHSIDLLLNISSS